MKTLDLVRNPSGRQIRYWKSSGSRYANLVFWLPQFLFLLPLQQSLGVAFVCLAVLARHLAAAGTDAFDRAVMIAFSLARTPLRFEIETFDHLFELPATCVGFG